MTLEIRSFAAELSLRGDGDGRTVVGVAVPYGQPARIGYRTTETFTRGAFTGTDPADVPFTATHPKDGAELPIGITVELRDEPDGLHGAWRVSRTQLGDDVLALIGDGAVRYLSIGFAELPGGDRWNRERTHVERTHARLDHVATVRAGAYPGAVIAGIRADVGEMHPAYPLATLARRWR
jgi:HK97 family phage prohead protease